MSSVQAVWQVQLTAMLGCRLQNSLEERLLTQASPDAADGSMSTHDRSVSNTAVGVTPASVDEAGGSIGSLVPAPSSPYQERQACSGAARWDPSLQTCVAAPASKNAGRARGCCQRWPLNSERRADKCRWMYVPGTCMPACRASGNDGRHQGSFGHLCKQPRESIRIM